MSNITAVDTPPTLLAACRTSSRNRFNQSCQAGLVLIPQTRGLSGLTATPDLEELSSLAATLIAVPRTTCSVSALVFCPTRNFRKFCRSYWTAVAGESPTKLFTSRRKMLPSFGPNYYFYN